MLAAHDVEKKPHHGEPTGRSDTESARALATWKQSRRRPSMYADWDQTVMLHYAIDPAALQPQIPFPLDTRRGVAYVSLVAFTLRRLRAAALPESFRTLLLPLSDHGFLNVRTYVRVARRRGIYFLAEWLPNRLALLLGPPLYGLPYRFGTTEYEYDSVDGRWRGRVIPSDEDAALEYHGEIDGTGDYTPAMDGSLDAFLLERYTAFTERRGTRRSFEVWHEPWPQQRAVMNLSDDTLAGVTGPWHREAEHALTHVSPGVQNVWMGPPRRLKEAA